MSEEKKQDENRNMQQCNGHNGVRLVFDAPIVMTIMSDGEPLYILCRRDFHQAILDNEMLTYSYPPPDKDQRADRA